jgi:hypothetical protein
MADTLGKHVADPKHLRTYIPEYLDARFAGIDVKLAELRALLLERNCQFTRFEARLDEAATRLDACLTELSRKIDTRGNKLDEVLARLPKP